MMNYCVECGTKLEKKFLENEGEVPFCPSCNEYRFPIFNSAVSMVIMNPTRDKILLIKQYGRDRYILVAGYINRGEAAEDTVKREIMEEIGFEVENITFNKSKFFEKSNTLMNNFYCTAKSEDLSGMTKEVDVATWFTFEEAKKNIAHGSLAEEFLLAFLEKNHTESTQHIISEK